MAESDTAVLEPETAVDAPETEDTAALAPETDGEETPETEDTPEAITLEAHEKALEAERQKVRDELQSEAEEKARASAAQLRRTEAQKLRSGFGHQELAKLAQWAYGRGESGEKFDLNPAVLQELVARFEGSVFQEQSDAWQEQFNGYLAKHAKDWKPSREVTARIAAASRDWRPNDLVEAQFDAMREAVREELAPKIREELEAELAEEGGVKKLKQAEATRKSQKGPTPAVAGGAGRSLTSLSDYETKLAHEGLSNDEWAGYEKARRTAGLS